MVEFGQRLEGWLLEDDLAWDRTAQLAAVMVNAMTGKPAHPRHYRPPRHTGAGQRPESEQRRSVEAARADLQNLKREMHRSPS